MPFKGPDRISKIDFYSLVGEYDRAEALRAETNRDNALNTAGYIVLGAGIAGLVGTLVANLILPESDNNLGIIIGYSASSVVALASIPLLVWEVDESTSVSFAVNLANIYNQNLYDSLK